MQNVSSPRNVISKEAKDDLSLRALPVMGPSPPDHRLCSTGVGEDLWSSTFLPNNHPYFSYFILRIGVT